VFCCRLLEILQATVKGEAQVNRLAGESGPDSKEMHRAATITTDEDDAARKPYRWPGSFAGTERKGL
jgi:hypothetical protein